jgi:hypothetical protein
MPWPPSDPKKVCAFWTCDHSMVTIRSFLKLWRTVDHYGTSILELEPQETWLCMNHENIVKIARRDAREFKIRRSLEGWVWIDTLDWLRFAV